MDSERSRLRCGLVVEDEPSRFGGRLSVEKVRAGMFQAVFLTKVAERGRRGMVLSWTRNRRG